MNFRHDHQYLRKHNSGVDQSFLGLKLVVFAVSTHGQVFYVLSQSFLLKLMITYTRVSCFQNFGYSTDGQSTAVIVTAQAAATVVAVAATEP